MVSFYMFRKFGSHKRVSFSDTKNTVLRQTSVY